MVSTTFVHQSKIDLTLPEASQEVVEDAIDKIDVAIDKQGQLFVNGNALINSQLESIKQALRDARPEGVEPMVIIRADAQASHQMVISVMDAARQVGLFRITFPTTVPRENEAD
jgi:biopolymer transport protein ExbD